MIPKQITARNVKQAIAYVSTEQVPPERKSKGYDLVYEGEPFPPKYLISLAAEFSAYGDFFYHGRFNSVEARNYLSNLGFSVQKKDRFKSAEVLDDLAPKSTRQPTIDDLAKALKNLKTLPPQRVTKLIEISNRRDTPLIKLLKKLYGFKCQMPGCKAVIKKKNGELYCEVAHIIPFAETLSSTIDNLIVLCPNHHKEFDHGELEVLKRSKKLIKGKLNGRPFNLKFKAL
jgi:5-methylcytosine-specific restriction endonuclease McrA